MASIDASTSGAGGIITTADNTGNLNLQSGGSTIATVSSTGLSMATGKTFSVGGVTGSPYTMKNRIINGACVVAQYGTTSLTVDNTAVKYGVDRMAAYGNIAASKFTVQQNAGSVTPPVGYTKYLGATSSSAYAVAATDIFYVFQRIEGFNIADLAWGTANAKTITLSFQVYSSLTGTFGGSIANGGETRSYAFSYSIPTANTWTTINVTIPGDTSGTWASDNTAGMEVNFSLGAGTSRSGTANTWTASMLYQPTGSTSVVGTSGATWYVTGVQLEVGSNATQFEWRPYGTELALCQRYYYRITPGANQIEFGCGMAQNTAVADGNIPFLVSMRTAPTALEQDGTAADYGMQTGGGARVNCSAVPVFNNATTVQSNVRFTRASGLTAGQIILFQTGSSGSTAYLAWSAEL
jgi:hypothetical protein